MWIFSLDIFPGMINITEGKTVEALYDIVNISGKPWMVPGKYHVEGWINYVDEYIETDQPNIILSEISVTPIHEIAMRVWRNGEVVPLGLQKDQPSKTWTPLLMANAYTDRTHVIHYRERNTKLWLPVNHN